MAQKQNLHNFIKRELKQQVESDKRLIQPNMTEYTLQAIIWDHLCRFTKDEWTLSIEDYIPNTNLKADIVIYKLTKENQVDIRFGAIAIEVKPKGRLVGIVNDVKKLIKYTRKESNEVNFGVMIYKTSVQSI